MPSLFEIRAVSSLFLLLLIQIFVLACMVGLERYSYCLLNNMLKLGCNVLK